MNIVFTGFMGTGKTTLGKLLAQELSYTFVDTDDLIVAKCGLTISDIFQRYGEIYFRQLEAEVAVNLGAADHHVIATGGGLRFSIRKIW